MTQHDQIRDYMKQFGSITTRDAFHDLEITKLSTRISEMRANGEVIYGETIKYKNRFGKTKHYMRYWLG